MPKLKGGFSFAVSSDERMVFLAGGSIRTEIVSMIALTIFL